MLRRKALHLIDDALSVFSLMYENTLQKTKEL